MKTANMGGGKRMCVWLLVILVNSQLIAGKPFFGTAFWCDMFCEDDDDTTSTTSTTTSLEDLLDSMFDPCTDCPTRRPTTPNTPTPNPNGQQPFNLMIPPSNGMNVSLTNTGNSWLMNFIPWAGGPPTPAAAPPPATTAAPVTTTAAGATTAAPGTTTKAPTTAAPK